MSIIPIPGVMLTAFLLSCLAVRAEAAGKQEGGEKMSIEVTSTAFENEGMIPARYTCDGADVSPPISLSGVPEGARSIALICDDPDAPAGTWVHWVVYDLSPDIKDLPEAVPPDKTVLGGAKQGLNDFRKIGYGGPCPPGGTHRYFFKVYALDAALNLKPGATKRELLQSMEGHVLAEGQLIGRYRR